MDQSLFGEQIGVISDHFDDIRDVIDLIRSEIAANDEIRDLFNTWKQVGYRISDEEYVSSKQQVRKENPDNRVYVRVYAIETVLSLILRLVAMKKINPGLKVSDFDEIESSISEMRASDLSFLFEEDIYDIWKYMSRSEEARRLEAGLLLRLNQLIDSLYVLPPNQLFLVLHQKVLNIESRKLLGEFYTPAELAEIIIQKGMRNLAKQRPKVLDLSCGAGNLLLAYLKHAQFDDGTAEIMNVVGIDINPLGRIMTKFTLGFFQWDRSLIVQDPLVFCADSLITYASSKNQVHLNKNQPDLLSFLPLPIDQGKKKPHNSRNRITVDFMGELREIELSMTIDRDLAITRTTLLAEMEKCVNSEPSGISLPGEVKSIIQSSKISRYLQGLLVDKVCARQAMNCKYGLVVGNPPYLRVQSIQPLWKRTTLVSTFRSAAGHFDLYYLFIELGIELLASNGLLSYITSNKFMTTSAGRSIRRIITKSCSLIDLTDFTDSHVFDALILPAIMILRKSKDGREFLMTEVKKIKVDAFETRGLVDLVDLLNDEGTWDQKQWQIDGKSLVSIIRYSNAQPRDEDDWIFLDPASREILDLIKARKTVTLNEICAKITVGIKTTANYAFIDNFTDEFINQPEILDERNKIKEKYGRDLFYPLIQGIDIRDFQLHDTDELKGSNIFFPHYKDNENKFAAYDEDDMPVILNYLMEKGYRESLKNREYVTGANRHWYEIWNPKDPDLMERALKIVVPDISPKNNFAIDHSRRYVDGSAYFIVLKDESLENYRYVLGILNSYVCEYFHKLNSGNNIYAGRYRYWSASIKNLPIILRSETSPDLAAQLIGLVGELEENYSQELEESMNEIVFEIFGINGDVKAAIKNWVILQRKIGQKKK